MKCLCGKEMKRTGSSGDGLEEPRYEHYICSCGRQGDLRQDGISYFDSEYYQCYNCDNEATRVLKEEGFDDTYCCQRCLEELVDYTKGDKDIYFTVEEIG